MLIPNAEHLLAYLTFQGAFNNLVLLWVERSGLAKLICKVGFYKYLLVLMGTISDTSFLVKI